MTQKGVYDQFGYSIPTMKFPMVQTFMCITGLNFCALQNWNQQKREAHQDDFLNQNQWLIQPGQAIIMLPESYLIEIKSVGLISCYSHHYENNHTGHKQNFEG